MGMGPQVGEAAAITVRELIATNVSRLRAGARIPVERIVEAAEAVGLHWTPAWVLALEHGQKPLTSEQLLALPVVLSAALSHRVTLADLLAGDEQVMLVRTPVAAAYLREAVTGNPLQNSNLSDYAQDATALLKATNAAAVQKMQLVRAANLGDVDVRTLGRAEAGSGSAEAKLARRLGVPEIVVIAAAAILWGRSLSDERDVRLRENQALTAASVNRRLTAELTKRINDAQSGVIRTPI